MSIVQFKGHIFNLSFKVIHSPLQHQIIGRDGLNSLSGMDRQDHTII